jgi:hypothetical protein
MTALWTWGRLSASAAPHCWALIGTDKSMALRGTTSNQMRWGYGIGLGPARRARIGFV